MYIATEKLTLRFRDEYTFRSLFYLAFTREFSQRASRQNTS